MRAFEADLPEDAAFGQVVTYRTLAGGSGVSAGSARVVRSLPDQVALSPPTSGSTGKPKAVWLTHRTILAGLRAQAATFEFAGHDVTITCTALDHALGLPPYHLLPMAFGADRVH